MAAINWWRELGPAVLKAKTEGRPLLVDFYSDTCLGCQAMEARTYPNPELAALIEREFVPVKFNVKEPRAEFRDLLRMTKPLFTPLLLMLDSTGTELRRTTGYLPVPELEADLRLVLGLADLLHARYESAYVRLREVADRLRETHAAAEALYWSGVAAYRRNGRGLEGLTPEWAELQSRYPGSTWAQRASCLPHDDATSLRDYEATDNRGQIPSPVAT
jgi:thiol-disulfide isomerase/thioredoxin